MIQDILEEVQSHGLRATALPVERLRDLQSDLTAFAASDALNGFQRYIVTRMYQFDFPDCRFPIRSVIIAAMPGPVWADVVFSQGGREHRVRGMACCYPGGAPVEQTAGDLLADLLQARGYHITTAPTLPLKRLAVCSGLAKYGRNNITYVQGMGSFQSLAAFYTDLPVEEGQWRAPVMMARCEHCTVCLNNCPTGAIRPDRFLIDNERCLSCLNEVPDPFPDWLPASVHHCLYDCLRCQEACPENKSRVHDVVGPISFDEHETEALLAGAPLAGFSPEAQEKIRFLGMDRWMDAIPRNLAALMRND